VTGQGRTATVDDLAESGHILTVGRSEADADYDRSRDGTDSAWCRKHRTEVPDADVQVTATPTDAGRRRQRQLVMATNRRNRPEAILRTRGEWSLKSPLRGDVMRLANKPPASFAGKSALD